jgi:hypothetical protein
MKPEFWSSPGNKGLEFAARLLFAAMWNWADDAGRGTANPRELAGFAFPHDEDIDSADIRRMLGGIRRAFDVEFYEVDGRAYYAIPSWERHQRIDKRSGPKYPSPEEGIPWDPEPERLSDQQQRPDSETSAEPSTEPAEDPASPRRILGAGTGEQGNSNKYISSSASRPRVRAPQPGSDQDPDWVKFWAAYPNRRGKKEAREAWAKAVKKTSPAEIIAGAERYAGEVSRQRTPADKVKYAQGWLNGERWNDEYAATTRPSGAFWDN